MEKALKNRISVSETMWQPGAGVVKKKKIQEENTLRQSTDILEGV